MKKVATTPPPFDFDGLPYPRVRCYPQFFVIKMTAKDAKGITFMPKITFFSVLERPEKTVRGVATIPLVRRGLKHTASQDIWNASKLLITKTKEREMKFKNICYKQILETSFQV